MLDINKIKQLLKRLENFNYVELEDDIEYINIKIAKAQLSLLLEIRELLVSQINPKRKVVKRPTKNPQDIIVGA